MNSKYKNYWQNKIKSYIMCRIPSDESLAEAKRNVEKYYVVVGLTEKLKEYFVVLEKLLPRYFKGVTQAYAKSCKYIFIYKCRTHPRPRKRLKQRLLSPKV